MPMFIECMTVFIVLKTVRFAECLLYEASLQQGVSETQCSCKVVLYSSSVLVSTVLLL